MSNANSVLVRGIYVYKQIQKASTHLKKEQLGFRQTKKRNNTDVLQRNRHIDSIEEHGVKDIQNKDQLSSALESAMKQAANEHLTDKENPG